MKALELRQIEDMSRDEVGRYLRDLFEEYEEADRERCLSTSPDRTAAKIQVVMADLSRRELGRASAVAFLALLVSLASLIVALVK
jgi:hypothetical protein